MGYWSIMIFVCTALLIMVGLLCYIIIKRKDEENICVFVFGICMTLALLIYCGFDIPDVLSGGRKLYVEEFPTVIQMRYFYIIDADGKLLTSFTRYNTDEFDKDAEYCISYTRFTRSVLSIEKAE